MTNNHGDDPKTFYILDDIIIYCLQNNGSCEGGGSGECDANATAKFEL